MISSHGGQVEFGIDRPHPARVWNYWLGGKEYYPADKAAGDVVERIVPGIVDSARADRAFLERCVQHLVTCGITQFLDVGSGLPTAGSTHEVAQRLVPHARVVYAAGDPLVLAHSRSLLTRTLQGATACVGADLRRPETILKAAAETLDLTRPVGLMMPGVLQNILDDDEAYGIVDELVDAVPPGSYLAIAHPTPEIHGDAMHEAIRRFTERGGIPIVARDRTRLARFFAGLHILDPGIVSCNRWRPTPSPWGKPPEVSQFCAVARKP